MRHAIVTGGSSGIGEATAYALSKTGWRVSVLALPDVDLDRVAAANGDVFKCIPVDVTDGAAVFDAIAQAEAAFGPVDVLVTSAGIAHPGRFMDLDPDTFHRQMDVNYFGSLNAVAAVYDGMTRRGRGCIGLISSGAGLCGIFGHTAYAPTKFAIRGFGEALRAEAQPFGVSVTLCYLPDTDTPQMRANDPVRPAECARISGASNPWPADTIGAAIAKGVLSGKRCVTPGWKMKLLVRFVDPLAGLLRWHFDRQVRAVSTDADA
jgi:NAD(P)-dependent dehydrogenase (short-subunit alcohol dehydrogenase family)